MTARSTPSTVLTMREPACAACRVLRARVSVDQAFLAGAALGHAAPLELCPKHREMRGHVALQFFGAVARAQSTVEPRLVAPKDRRRRRRAWLAGEPKK